MAVTTGYYGRLADTVLTRAKAATPYVYDLDVQFDPSEEGMAEIVAFVGRYLNAARLGREKLDAEGVRSAEDVPNFCDRLRLPPAMPSGLRELLRRPRHLPVQRGRPASCDPRASRARQSGRVQSAGRHRRSSTKRPRRARRISRRRHVPERQLPDGIPHRSL